MTDTRRTLLVIGYVWPEPDSSAAGSRMLQLIQAFQQDGYRIIFASPADASDHAPDLAALQIEAQAIALNCTSFDSFVTQLAPDVVMFDRFMMEEQFGWRVEKACPQALRLLDTEDLHCLRHARHALLRADPAADVLQPADRFLFSELAVREVAAILRCDLTLMISAAEMTLLRERFQVPAEQLLYIPFMQQALADPHPLSYEQRRHFVSIGNFRHEPNWDAVRYLKETLWPPIRKALPQAELHVYGAYPPKKATQLHNEQQGFLVKGWADNAHQVIRQARVLLAPLRFGAGLKGKLLDAAYCGTPAVTTPVGAEAMYDQNQPGARVAAEAAEFVVQAVALYQDRSQWQPLHENALQLLARRYAFSEHAPHLMGRVQALLADTDGHRQPLFFNRMLRHHTLKSSQYMSQWIEAKNRLSGEQP